MLNNNCLNIDSKLPCSLEPCGDYGECLDTQDGSFYCECRKEYTGRKCGNSKIFNWCEKHFALS